MTIALPVCGQAIDVLTYDQTRTTNPFETSAGYSSARNALLSQSNFGSAGVVPQFVQSITSVPAITPSSLSGMEVVILASIASTPSAAENAALSEWIAAGGGLLVADNNASLFLQPILGVTPGGFDSDGGANVSNPLSPITNGPFGSYGTGFHVNTGFAGSFAADGLSPAGTEAMTNSEGVFAASFAFGDGFVVAFADEEVFASPGFVGGDPHLSAATEDFFLNSFAYVSAVPEPSSGFLVPGAMGCWLITRRRGHIQRG